MNNPVLESSLTIYVHRLDNSMGSQTAENTLKIPFARNAIRYSYLFPGQSTMAICQMTPAILSMSKTICRTAPGGSHLAMRHRAGGIFQMAGVSRNVCPIRYGSIAG